MAFRQGLHAPRRVAVAITLCGAYKAGLILGWIAVALNLFTLIRVMLSFYEYHGSTDLTLTISWGPLAIAPANRLSMREKRPLVNHFGDQGTRDVSKSE